MALKLRREKGKLKQHRSHLTGKGRFKLRPGLADQLARKAKKLEKELRHANGSA